MTEYDYRTPEPYAVPGNTIKLNRNTGKIFDQIYKEELWSSHGDGSGGDSRPEMIPLFFDTFTKILEDYSVKSIADFGCGSNYIWKDYIWPNKIKYDGYDVSSIALDKARKNCKQESFNFHKLKSGIDYTSISSHDLILAKDVLCHWKQEDGHDFIHWAMDNFKVVVIAGIVQIHLTKEIEDLSNKSFFFTTSQDELYGVWIFHE